MMGGKSPVYRFDEVEIDVSNLQVKLRGEIRPLEPKSFRLLVLLVENPQRVISKDEIMAAVWPDTAVSDNSLARAITQVRKALDDDPKSPRYIETVPTVGYRFAGGLRVEEALPLVRRRRMPYPWIIGGALSLCVLFGFCEFLLVSHPPATYPMKVAGITRLTSYTGDEREPAVSPDGSLVAFSWSGALGDNYDIYVVRGGAQQPLRLTQDPAPDSYPAWSPDGSEIAFVRQRGQSAEIIVVPPLGGPERILHHFVRLGADLDFSQHPVLVWAPDGRTIFYSGLANAGEQYRLYALSLDGGTVHPLSTPGGNDVGDSSPAITADGKYLAFVRYLAPRNGRVMIQALSPGAIPVGEPVAVSGAGLDPRSPIWLDNGNNLLFADPGRIFQWNRAKGATPIYQAEDDIGSASLGPRKIGAEQLVMAVNPEDSDIFSMALDPRSMRAVGSSHVLASSTASDSHPEYSPDGRFVTFVSARSGAPELWIANADGSSPRQLTHLGAYILSYPAWSPDGTKIAFHARMPDVAEVYVLDVAEGEARQITHEISPGPALASWSHDGMHLYASTLVGGKATTYQFSPAGGAMQKMWEGARVRESVDGKYVLYYKSDRAGIFRRSLSGDPRNNPEELLIPDFWPTGQLGGYAPVKDGIYYVSGDEHGRPAPFRFFSYANGKSVEVAPPVHGLGLGFTVSPDQRSMAFVANANRGGDLWMLKLQ